MFTLGPIGFAIPSLLLALIALPVLWFLLRAVPPAPIRRRFPGVALLLGLVAWLRPAPAPAAAALQAQVGYAELKPVIEQRCQSCHGAAVQMKNLRLDSQALLEQHAQMVYQQVVVTKIMPLSNATQMTDAERALVARWFEGQGAAK